MSINSQPFAPMPNWFKRGASASPRQATGEAASPDWSAHPKKLSADFSGALRTFSFWVANGSVGQAVLEGIEYRTTMMEEPSLLEMTYAIFANVIEFDENGTPTNAKYAEHRAAQYIRSYVDPDYVVSPPFEAWEQELYGPPNVNDSKPWPPGVAL